MLPTHCGKWLHTACALWIPEAVVSSDDLTGVPKADIDDIPKVPFLIHTDIRRR